jgi:hypothetical protein
MDQIRKSVVQIGGGVGGRQPVRMMLKMIRVATRMTFLFNEDIVILQVGLIVFLHYINEKISNFVTKRNIYIQCNLNNWLYRYIYFDKRAGGDLHKHLRYQKKRRKRYGSNERRE